MAQYSKIVKLAKQGDARAIAYLITRTLHRYGITARANLRGRCLKLLLEADQVPHQSTMVKLVAQGMKKLNPKAIQTIKLYGRSLDQEMPAWRQVIELVPPLPEPIAADSEKADFDQSDFGKSDFEQSDFDSSEIPIFQLNDLDPEAMILLPVEPKVQLEDLDPDALILFPVEPVSTPHTDSASSPVIADPSSEALDQPKPRDSVKLPKRLTLLLLSFLWLQLGVDTLTLMYSLLSAGSFSLYTGLDLSNTNQPFASLLAAVVSIADFLFAPLDGSGLWINLVVIVLFLLWLHRLHASLRGLFGRYPISPWGAVVRFGLPIYNLWGIGNTCFTLATRLANSVHLNRSSQLIRRLTIWLYILLLLATGLQGLYLWLLSRGSTAIASLWYYVARDVTAWLLSLVWLRLVRTIWRSVRRAYQELMPPIQTAAKPPAKPARVDIGAILLGASASLLSLTLFNCLLGVLAASVFVSNGLQPESIVPTFYDSESLLMLVLLGSFLCIGLGGFLTAQLAATGMAHALGLGVFLLLIGIALQRLAMLPAIAELPFWFQTASAVLIIPAALIGGGLRQWLKTL